MADEERKRLTLNSQHWQILAVGNTGRAIGLMQEMFQHLQQLPFPTAENVAALDNHWAMVQANWQFVRSQILRGWQIAAKNEGLTMSPPQPQVRQESQSTQNNAPAKYDELIPLSSMTQEQLDAYNAAHPERIPVKKGGWPKGKKRTPKQAPQSSAAVLPPVTQ